MGGTAPGRRYAGVSAEERKRERHERLLEAGLVLLGTRGYAQTTVSDVLEQAGLTSRYFYEHFKNRESLLVAVYDESVRRGYGASASAIARHIGDPLEVSISAQVLAFFDVCVDDPRMGRVLFVEAIGVSAEMEAHRRIVMRKVARAMAKRFRLRAAAGEIAARSDEEFHAVSLALLGAMHELVADHLHAGGISRDAAAAESVRLVVASLRGATPAVVAGA